MQPLCSLPACRLFRCTSAAPARRLQLLLAQPKRWHVGRSDSGCSISSVPLLHGRTMVRREIAAWPRSFAGCLRHRPFQAVRDAVAIRRIASRMAISPQFRCLCRCRIAALIAATTAALSLPVIGLPLPLRSHSAIFSPAFPLPFPPPYIDLPLHVFDHSPPIDLRPFASP